MPEPSPKAPFKWLTTWVYPDNLEPLDVFRGLRPRPGEGMVVEVVIDEPTKTQEKILLGLAKNASTMWPGWYVPWDKAYGEDGLSLWPLYPSAAPSEIRGVDRYWLRRATASIGQNLIPYFSDLPADHQAIQLGLALKHFIDAIHVAIAPEVDFEPGRWVRFDRRLEAIWSLTTIPITFLLSESLSRHSQFEEALYRFQRYEPGTSYSDQAGLFGQLGQREPTGQVGQAEQIGPAGQLEQIKHAGQRDQPEKIVPTGQGGQRGQSDQPKQIGQPSQPEQIVPTGQAGQTAPTERHDESIEVSPEQISPVKAGDDSFELTSKVSGLPHPQSPPEISLNDAMKKDKRFEGMFLLNHPLTSFGHTMVVDLYWPGGDLVVEVDGFKYHCNQKAFQNDRHRDYLHVISGRTVLRLTAKEVMDDEGISLEKIWQVVTFLAKRQGISLRGE